ncbi:MAG: hypothetical protein HY681_14320 [Chloroflexi bacterium]|nr:hypothetical protein [Chloroflexota bacterium]
MSFIAIGIDPYEKLDDLVAYKKAQGYPWPVAVAPAGILPAYDITIQATKVAVNRQGVITFREGYGVMGEDAWRNVFEDLSS